MNIALGFLISFGAFLFCTQEAHLNTSKLLNLSGLVIVLSGTLTAYLISVGLKRTLLLSKVLFLMSFQKKHFFPKLKEIINSHYVGNPLPDLEDTFLKKGVNLLNVGLEAGEVESILTSRLNNDFERRNELALMFNNLSKYPPALGMIGTVFSMMGVFSQISLESSSPVIGQHIATAMLSTLYGLMLSNYFLSPLAERVLHLNEDWYREKSAALNTFIHLASNKNKTYTQEFLENYEKAS